MDPERKDSLGRMPELPGAREHAAAVDPDGETKGFAIFQSETFGGELAASVKRNGRGRRKIFCHALTSHASR